MTTHPTSLMESVTSKEKEEEPKNEEEEEATYRMYLGGFKENITSSDLAHLFRSFGTVENIQFPQSSNGFFRSFLHFNLITTPSTFTQCVSRLNKTTWKGGRLQLQLAHPDYITKLNTIATYSKHVPVTFDNGAKEALSHKSTPHLLLVGEESHDLNLVHEENMDRHHRLWKRGRFGRPIALMRKMRRLDNSLLTIDPVLHKHQLERLYLNPKPTSVAHLSWEYSSSHPKQNHHGLMVDSSSSSSSTSLEKSFSHFDSSDEEDAVNEKLMGKSTDITSPLSPSFPSKNKLFENDKRNEEIEEKNPALTLFDDDGLHDESDLQQVKDSFAKAEFEGTLAPELLSLQRKAKGDPRFQWTPDFVPNAIDPSLHPDSASLAPVAPTSELASETALSKKILSEMFGNVLPSPTPPPPTAGVSTSSDLLGMSYYEPPTASASTPTPTVTAATDLSMVFTKHGPTVEAKTFTLFGDLFSSSHNDTNATKESAHQHVPLWQSVPVLPKTTLMSPLFFQCVDGTSKASWRFRREGSLSQRKWWWQQHRQSILKQVKNQHAKAVYHVQKKQKWSAKKSQR